MSVAERALAVFDGWVFEPPYPRPLVPWPWHVGVLAWYVACFVGMLSELGWPGLALLPFSAFFVAKRARRAYIWKYPDRRRDGRVLSANGKVRSR